MSGPGRAVAGAGAPLATALDGGIKRRWVARISGRAWVTLAIVMAILWSVSAALAAPRLGFSPSRLVFSAHGSPRGESRVVMLRNLGDAPLQLKAVAFSADSAGFGTEQLVPQVLAPGQSLPVTVTYARSGARPQAFGALLVYSDDPGGFDDPRSQERDWVRGVALVAGESTVTLWLWLPPLVAAGLLLALRRRRKHWLAPALQWTGVLLPLLASLWLLWHFDRCFAVPDGNYGIQLGLHRALWPTRGVELWMGLDGLSLPLVLLLAAAAALQLLWPRPEGERAADAPAALMLSAGALLVLCSLDAGILLLGWELALLGAFARLGGWGGSPGRLRPRGLGRWFVGSQLGVLLLAGALGVVYAHSLPTALVDGTTVAHSTDLVKLGYYNYFGDVALGGVPLARPLWATLTLGALLPVLLLPRVAVPLGERLWLSLPLLVVGVYGTVRLAFYLLPQAGVALGPWVVGAALVWALAFTLRALLKKNLPQLLVAAVMARTGGTGHRRDCRAGRCDVRQRHVVRRRRRIGDLIDGQVSRCSGRLDHPEPVPRRSAGRRRPLAAIGRPDDQCGFAPYRRCRTPLGGAAPVPDGATTGPSRDAPGRC